MSDLASNIVITPSIAPDARADGTVNGTAISHENFLNATFVLSIGAIGADATITWKLQESANGSTNWTDVETARLIGNFASGEANTVQVVGVTNIEGFVKTHLRPVVVVTAGEDITVAYGVLAILGGSKNTPVDESAYIS